MDYEPQNRSNLRDRADAHSAAVNQWRQSCVPDGKKPPVDWTTLARHDVPEKIAMCIAWKLTERGAPLDNWRIGDILPHLHAIAVEGKKVVAVLVRPAFFNLIHQHLHGFTMSVFGEMIERKEGNCRWLPVGANLCSKMIGKTMRCLACNEWIVWGIKNAKMHPFNVNFDKIGHPHQADSHELTCRKINQQLRKREKTLSARAERQIEDVSRWRASCCDTGSRSPRTLCWDGVHIHDVPEKHSIPIAHKLVERGGPFARWHACDLLEHFRAIAVHNGFVMWVLLTVGIYNLIHGHLYGFMMSIHSDMQERLPVTVARYPLEPICILPKLPYNQVRNFSLAERYTL